MALLVVISPRPAIATSAQDRERAVRTRLADDYQAIRQRPLFSPDRKPPAVIEPVPFVEEETEYVIPPEAAPAPVAAPNWELVGLVRSERLNRAIFRKAGSPIFFDMLKGETLDGWTLSDVGRFEVFVENGQDRLRIGFPDR
ncbi:hypothetical protein [Neoaquamicrobium sediminum]|uniref:hypothetical protein n=1 Tax=Neoaquamicrobium sediminum TaxID=1849104 RepID=UPI0015670ACD|nr:hypothetical protein [Mesorhizobium sediminum]NRC56192.1 hypothetical protein [Mesorhizobium sediminum]